MKYVVQSDIVPELNGLIVETTGETVEREDETLTQNKCDASLYEGRNAQILAQYALAVYGLSDPSEVVTADERGVSHDWWFLAKELHEPGTTPTGA